MYFENTFRPKYNFKILYFSTEKYLIRFNFISIMNKIPNECTVLHLNYRFETNNICYLILQKNF